MKKPLLRVAATLLIGLLSATAQADTYPSKPITVIVGYSPGGSNDLIARTVSEELSKRLGQPVLVENAAGAAGTIGAAKTVRAPADGYTLLLGSGSEISIAKFTTPSIKYDGQKDLAPITMVGTQPMVLVGANNLAPKNTAELLAYARANPDKLSFASSGVGTPLHLSGELIKQKAKISMEHVPYKGAGPMLTDLLGGQIPLAVTVLSSSLQHIKAGKVKVYGVTTAKRIGSMPEVPTMNEAGLPNFTVTVWHAMYAPKGTPKAIVDQLSQALQVALKDPTLGQRFADLGSEPVSQERATPEALRAQLKSEIDKWGPIIKKAGVFAD